MTSSKTLHAKITINPLYLNLVHFQSSSLKNSILFYS